MKTHPPTRKRILAVGEVLFDNLPGGSRPGGAPANFAIHARGLGCDARLLTRVGDDSHGQRLRAFLEGFGLDPHLIQVDETVPTGIVQVNLIEGHDAEYTIPMPAAWDEIQLDRDILARLKQFAPELLCFGTLVQRTPKGADLIDRLVDHVGRNCLIMCDLNLRKGHISLSRVLRSLEHCGILKLNADELTFLSKHLGLRGSRRERLEDLSRRFHISTIALTLGAKGSLLKRNEHWAESPAVSLAEPANTVGAGDAFAAALAAGILRGDDPDGILQAAGHLAAAVCRLPGAVPESPDTLLNFPYSRPHGETP